MAPADTMPVDVTRRDLEGGVHRAPALQPWMARHWRARLFDALGQRGSVDLAAKFA